MKILVTGAGALLGQGILRSLRESRLDPHLIAVDPSPLAPGLYWADEAHLVPMAGDPRYLPELTALLARIRPDVVLVGTDVELELFAVHRAALERESGAVIVVSTPEVVRIADDKYETFRFLSERGFPHPRSALPGGEDELVEEVGFPLVVKPRVGARSIGVHVVRDRAELARAVSQVHAPVIQEHLADAEHEYTAGALCFDGEVDATIVMRRDLRDGNTYRAYVEPFPELNAQVRALTQALAPYGPANFQFRVVEGQAKVFEINARFSGTTPFRMRVGLNEVERTIRRVLLGEKLPPPDIAPAIILRYFTEMVVAPDALVGRA